MNILTIDSSSSVLNLGIKANDNYDNLSFDAGKQLSVNIISQIDQLLTKHNLSAKQIDIIAYNQGPGSFTGLRIGLSVALGIAYSTDCNLMAIPAFYLYANKHTDKFRNLIVLLDARLGQLYLAGIDQITNKYLIEPQIVSPEKLSSLIAEHSELTINNTCVSGYNFRQYLGTQDMINQFNIIEQTHPSAMEMLRIVDQQLFPPVQLAAAELLYLRNKVALTSLEQQIKIHGN